MKKFLMIAVLAGGFCLLGSSARADHYGYGGRGFGLRIGVGGTRVSVYSGPRYGPRYGRYPVYHGPRHLPHPGYSVPVHRRGHHLHRHVLPYYPVYPRRYFCW